MYFYTFTCIYTVPIVFGSPTEEIISHNFIYEYLKGIVSEMKKLLLLWFFALKIEIIEGKYNIVVSFPIFV